MLELESRWHGVRLRGGCEVGDPVQVYAWRRNNASVRGYCDVDVVMGVFELPTRRESAGAACELPAGSEVIRAESMCPKG